MPILADILVLVHVKDFTQSRTWNLILWKHRYSFLMLRSAGILKQIIVIVTVVNAMVNPK